MDDQWRIALTWSPCTFSVDDDHRRRVKLLQKEMVKAVDVLDALQRRAYELYQPENALHATNDRAPSTAEAKFEKQSRQTTEELLECIRILGAFSASPRLFSSHAMPTTAEGDEDLIEVSLREYVSADSYRQNRSDTHPLMQPKGRDDQGIETVHGL